MQLTITPLADAGVEVLPPDIVWMTGNGVPAGDGPGVYGDFVVSAAPSDGSVGGFIARNPLRTAVIMLLFTDARADRAALTWADAGDRRGWVGDGFDIDRTNGEAELGSTLWLYRRHELTAKTAMQVKAEALRALQPLIKQGGAARIDVNATTDQSSPAGRINLDVAVYGRDGTKAYAAKFDLLWKQADGL